MERLHLCANDAACRGMHRIGPSMLSLDFCLYLTIGGGRWSASGMRCLLGLLEIYGVTSSVTAACGRVIKTSIIGLAKWLPFCRALGTSQVPLLPLPCMSRGY